MKRRTALWALAAVVVGVTWSHLEWTAQDERWILRVDGRPVDVLGQMAQLWNRHTRDCRAVHTLALHDPTAQTALTTLRQHSPPDSQSARITQLLQQHDWLLATVHFTQLTSAVVLLRVEGTAMRVVEGGIWSGTTHPHAPEPFIRHYLRTRVPEVPAELLACWTAEPLISPSTAP